MKLKYIRLWPAIDSFFFSGTLVRTYALVEFKAKFYSHIVRSSFMKSFFRSKRMYNFPSNFWRTPRVGAIVQIILYYRLTIPGHVTTFCFKAISVNYFLLRAFRKFMLARWHSLQFNHTFVNSSNTKPWKHQLRMGLSFNKIYSNVTVVHWMSP